MKKKKRKMKVQILKIKREMKLNQKRIFQKGIKNLKLTFLIKDLIGIVIMMKPISLKTQSLISKMSIKSISIFKMIKSMEFLK